MEKENDSEAEKNGGQQEGQAYLLPCGSCGPPPFNTVDNLLIRGGGIVTYVHRVH